MREFGTGESGDHEPVVVEWCTRDHVPLLPRLSLDGPHEVTALLIERDQLAVELTDVDAALTEPHTPARPSAADR